MRKFGRSVFLLLLVALSLASAAVALAQDDGQGGGSIYLPTVATHSTAASAEIEVVSDSVPLAEQKAALAYWTREKIAKVTALELPTQAGPAEVDFAAAAMPETARMPSFSAPGRPARGADQVARSAYATDWKAAAMMAEDEDTLEAGLAAEAGMQSSSVTEVQGTSRVYTSNIANWLSGLQRVYPHIWTGRFTFTTPNGTNYCTATAISGNNIVTAAHCVYDTPSRNQWYTNRVFTPAYRNGSAPYGSFAASTCTILTAWINLSGNYAINTWAPFDVAVCTVGTNSAGQTLNQAVGWAGKAWNYGYVRNIVNLGYPLQDYNDSWLSWQGSYLRLCAAETFQQTTDVRGMGCNWGGGASGGPWIDHRFLSSTTYGTDGYWPGRVSGYVNGVNSGKFTGTDNLYAGRFTSNNIVPLCNVRGC